MERAIEQSRTAWILVLEDDEGFRRFVTGALQHAGHSVVDTGDPVEALRLLETEARFELLIADVKMPKYQPHGTSIGNMAMLKRPRLPIIYMTGDPGGIPRGLVDAQEPTVLGKPFKVEALLASIQAALKRASSI